MLVEAPASTAAPTGSVCVEACMLCEGGTGTNRRWRCFSAAPVCVLASALVLGTGVGTVVGNGVGTGVGTGVEHWSRHRSRHRSRYRNIVKWRELKRMARVKVA